MRDYLPGEAMIDWIHARCKEWGYQMHKINLGNEGWPPRTILDKMIKEGILGAASGRFVQHYPECLGEEEVKINNAIKRMSETDREILFAYYVLRTKPKMIMAAYSFSRTQFYDCIDEIHKRINTSLYLVLSEQNSRFCSQNPTVA
jgi:hypothetical protein